MLSFQTNMENMNIQSLDQHSHSTNLHILGSENVCNVCLPHDPAEK